jgi:histidine triad (HIT) family protein
MTAAYDDGNVFAKILRGELPSHKVYEDDTVLVVMDIMPTADGHCLVLPKAPSRNLLDADPQVLQQLIPVVQKMAKAVKKAFNADGVAIYQFNEAAAGQSVFHLHFHVVPRLEGVAQRPHGSKMEDQAVLAANAERIRAAL